MKPILITITLLLLFAAAKAQTADTAMQAHSDTTIFTMIEKMPEFPNGGIGGFFKYLADSLRYPERARQRGTQGRVILTCVVEKDGSLDHVHILKSLSHETDAEAIRLIKESPKWTIGY